MKQIDLIQTILSKASLKQYVYRNLVNNFELMKNELKTMVENIAKTIKEKDKSVIVSYKDEHVFEAQIQFGGDVLVFTMHTNVFNFDSKHVIHKSNYVKDNPQNSYCGMIEIYNFLADSLKYQRINDTGYLIGRIFINKENHFFCEGKGQMGFLYNDFSGQVLNEETRKQIIQTTILYCIEFELWAPPINEVEEISVLEKIQQAGTIAHKTSKRMGFDMSLLNGTNSSES